MKASRVRLGVVLAFLVIGGCGGSSKSSRTTTAGSGGDGGDGGGGGEAGSGGRGGDSTGGSGGAAPQDAAPTRDSAGGLPDAPPSIDADVVVDLAMSLPDGGAGGDGGAVAVCWKDPKVIMICHQLENACINCGNGKNPPGNTDAVACFDLIKKAYAGMATDADCVKFAMDHVCKPDDVATTGNICGSLNCQLPGCKDPAKCEVVKQDGESDKCQPYAATCPCQ